SARSTGRPHRLLRLRVRCLARLCRAPRPVPFPGLTSTRSLQRGWRQDLIRPPAGSSPPRQTSLAVRPTNNKKPAPSLDKPTGRDNSDYRLRAWGEGWAVGGDPSPSGGASRWRERLLKPGFIAYIAAIALLVSVIAASAASPAIADSGVTRQIALAGTGSSVAGESSSDGHINPDLEFAAREEASS